MLFAIPAFFLPVVLVASLQGTLVPQIGFKTTEADLARLLRLGHGNADPYFPLLRDYPALIVILFTGLTCYLFYRNCHLMEGMINHLRDNNLMILDRHTLPVVKQELSKSNARFAAIGRLSIAIAFLSVGVAVLLFVSIRSSPIFLPLAPDAAHQARQSWGAVAYRSWWAGLDRRHIAGAVTYLAGSAFTVYVILKHNLAGVCFVSFFWGVRKQNVFTMDKRNVDGYYGWYPMRKLILSVFASVIASLIAFTSLFTLLPFHAISGYLPFALIYLVGIPIYVAMPIWLLNQAVSQFRRDEIARIVDRFNRVRRRVSSNYPRMLELDHLERKEIKFIRELHPRLFKLREIALGLVLYVVPTATSIVSFIRA
jgi:hypothetical protein